MSVTYKKLMIMLVERNMKKKDLKEQAGLTHHEMLKLRKDMNITTETIGKICKALNCEATDIMDFRSWDFIMRNLRKTDFFFLISITV